MFYFLLKHYIAQYVLFSVNYAGYYIQKNVLGLCNFIFVWQFCMKSIAFSFCIRSFVCPLLCIRESVLIQSFMAF